MNKKWKLLAASLCICVSAGSATAQEPVPQPVEVKVSPVESAPMATSIMHGTPAHMVVAPECTVCCIGHMIGTPRNCQGGSMQSWLCHFCYKPLPVPCDCQSKCCCCRSGCCNCSQPVWSFFIRHDWSGCDAPCCQQPCLKCDRSNWQP